MRAQALAQMQSGPLQNARLVSAKSTAEVRRCADAHQIFAEEQADFHRLEGVAAGRDNVELSEGFVIRAQECSNALKVT
jgi:hypothetical protein